METENFGLKGNDTSGISRLRTTEAAQASEYIRTPDHRSGHAFWTLLSLPEDSFLHSLHDLTLLVTQSSANPFRRITAQVGLRTTEAAQASEYIRTPDHRSGHAFWTLLSLPEDSFLHSLHDLTLLVTQSSANPFRRITAQVGLRTTEAAQASEYIRTPDHRSGHAFWTLLSLPEDSFLHSLHDLTLLVTQSSANPFRRITAQVGLRTTEAAQASEYIRTPDHRSGHAFWTLLSLPEDSFLHSLHDLTLLVTQSSANPFRRITAQVGLRTTEAAQASEYIRTPDHRSGHAFWTLLSLPEDSFLHSLHDLTLLVTQSSANPFRRITAQVGLRTIEAAQVSEYIGMPDYRSGHSIVFRALHSLPEDSFLDSLHNLILLVIQFSQFL
uniref:Uncharacterized protein n=1 Tax=Rhodnius prolixus TaxID=13249 RepID=T1IDM6_RHOPR